jgi:hypothetical protein
MMKPVSAPDLIRREHRVKPSPYPLSFISLIITSKKKEIAGGTGL